jgi:hypothetical protein
MEAKIDVDVEGKRKELRITSGADIIVRNVPPFLRLLERIDIGSVALQYSVCVRAVFIMPDPQLTCNIS